jgi:hypothetical protein
MCEEMRARRVILPYGGNLAVRIVERRGPGRVGTRDVSCSDDQNRRTTATRRGMSAS